MRTQRVGKQLCPRQGGLGRRSGLPGGGRAALGNRNWLYPLPPTTKPRGHKAMCLSFPEQGFPAGPPLRPRVRLPGTGHAPSRRLPTPDRSLLDHMELNSAFFAVRLRGDCVRGLLHPSDYAGALPRSHPPATGTPAWASTPPPGNVGASRRPPVP